MAPSLAASSSQFSPHLPYLISARRRTPPRHHYAAKSQPRMDLLGRSTACRVWSPPPTCSSSPLLRPRCSRDDPRPPPDNRGDDEDSRLSTDWDKAWSNFKKRGKKSLFSQFKPDKYVTWNPRRSEYPLSEEIDPIKRTERSNLVLWTSPKFTLIGAAVIVSLLLVYTLVAPLK